MNGWWHGIQIFWTESFVENDKHVYYIVFPYCFVSSIYHKINIGNLSITWWTAIWLERSPSMPLNALRTRTELASTHLNDSDRNCWFASISFQYLSRRFIITSRYYYKVCREPLFTSGVTSIGHNYLESGHDLNIAGTVPIMSTIQIRPTVRNIHNCRGIVKLHFWLEFRRGKPIYFSWLLMPTCSVRQ